MAAKKNTAQAYEVLYRMAKEKEAEARRAQESARSGGTGGAPAVAPGLDAGAATPKPLVRVDRSPLLAAGAEIRRARPRRQDRKRQGEPEPAGRPASRGQTHDVARRGGARSLLSELDAARARARSGASGAPAAAGAPRAPTRQDERLDLEARELLLREEPREDSPGAGGFDGTLAAADGDSIPPRRATPWAEPLAPAVDPALLGGEEPDAWRPPRRVRFLETPEPVLAAPPAAAAPRRDDPVPRPAAIGSGGASGGSDREADNNVAGSQRNEAEHGAGLPEAAAGPGGVAAPDAGRAAAPPAAGPAGWARPTWRRIAACGRWIAGDESVRALNRGVELKLSTLLVLGMSVVVVTALVLAYVRLPGPEDPLFRSRSTPSLAAAAPAAAQPPAAPVEAATSPVRHFPRWNPGTADDDEGRKPVAPLPEVRDVVEAPRPAPSPPPVPPALPEPAPPPQSDAPAVQDESSAATRQYLIQVRARESWDGAHRIFEYLSLFGFEKPLLEEDLREDQGGDKRYTVFVGRYNDRAEAERECARLKRETRTRPYRGQLRYFQDCLVITRDS